MLEDKYDLKYGSIYIVQHKDIVRNKISRKTRRIFYGVTKRFNKIDCLEFSSRIQNKVKTEIKNGELWISGLGNRNISQILQVPLYCIINIKSA